MKWKILAKYLGREKEVNDYLHKVSEHIAEYVEKNKLEVILENLIHIKKSINKRVKKYNRHSKTLWEFLFYL